MTLPLLFQVGSLCLLYPNIDSIVPSEAIKMLKKYECTALVGSPAFVEKLASHAQKNSAMLPVKYVGVGGAPVFRAALRTISGSTPDRKAAVLYGSTEAEPISMIFADEKLKLEMAGPDGLCVGKPVFKGSVKIIKILEGNAFLPFPPLHRFPPSLPLLSPPSPLPLHSLPPPPPLPLPPVFPFLL